MTQLRTTLRSSARRLFSAVGRLVGRSDAVRPIISIGQKLWRQQRAATFPRLIPPALNTDHQDLVNRFHNFMYDLADQNASRTYFVTWLGYGMLKWPTDLWIYQEIVHDTRPDVIIETGTHRGGSALFLATICDLLGHGRIVTIDIDETFRSAFPRHERITYLSGSSTDPAIIKAVTGSIGNYNNVLVILDSDHHCAHVLEELRLYSKFVPRGGHLIVEDTNINGHPAYPDFGPGPAEAVSIFLAENLEFYIDRDQERFFLTQNPRGFLRRRK